MPQLGRVHSEGERIHDGDPVILESVANVGLRLHISSHEIRSHGQPWLEVLASIEPTGFKLQRFRSVQAEAAEAAVSAKPLLFGGQAVRLLHVEANAYGEPLAVHPPSRPFAAPPRSPTHKIAQLHAPACRPMQRL